MKSLKGALLLFAAIFIPLMGFSYQTTDNQNVTKKEPSSMVLASIRFNFNFGGPCYSPCYYPCLNPCLSPYYYPYYPYYPRYGLGIRFGCGC